MKKINVHKLMLQFDADTVTSGTPEEQAQQIIDSINEEIGQQFPDACPQLFFDLKENKVEEEKYDDGTDDEEGEG